MNMLTCYITLVGLMLLTSCSGSNELGRISEPYRKQGSALMLPARVSPSGDEKAMQPHDLRPVGINKVPLVITCRPFPLGLEADCDPE